MFAKSKCFMVLNRVGRYAQSRSLRKHHHLKYSASAFEGVSGKLQVKRNCNHSHNAASSEACEEDRILSREYSQALVSNLKPHSTDLVFDRKKADLEGIIREAEDLLECRFQRSRSSPIGVGLSRSDCQTQYFNLLPDWFKSESSLIASRLPMLLGSGHPVLRLKQ